MKVMSHFLMLTVPLFLSATMASAQQRGDLRVMFYNTENFFDTSDDPATQDDEFTPEGRLHWTENRYRQKLIHLFKAIAVAGETEPPELIGLAEVENQKVLVDLTFLTPLSKYSYDIVHFDSPDPRGIDVALLYRADRFRVLKKYPVPVLFKKAQAHKTRDILYVQVLTPGRDTLNLFVNHWPSRLHGERETRFLRAQAAWALRKQTDSLLHNNPAARIIIMGDFNDTPFNQSITGVLGAALPDTIPKPSTLYNLSAWLARTSPQATHQYQGHWEMLDQFIVSGTLLSAPHGLSTSKENVHIITAPFLFSTDSDAFNPKLYRTYAGPQYKGGFSDHLPVCLDLTMKR